MMDNMIVVPPEAMTIVQSTPFDQWLPVIVSVLGLLWTVFKSSAVYRSWRERVGKETFDAVIRSLEAGVHTTYENYVREHKAANEGNKLTKEQREHARMSALQEAIKAAPAGVDVVKVLGGTPQAFATIDTLVNARKKKST